MLETALVPYGGVLQGTSVLLRIDRVGNPTASAEAERILDKAKNDYNLSKVEIVDIPSEATEIEMPYLATRVGRFFGLDEIRYFATLSGRMKTAVT